ncbi:hypothetical protein CsSME_00014727 [Camellia sinensis var. sinensis]
MYLPLISLLLKLACVLGAAFASAFATAPAQTLLGCENCCGNISIPYPFGTTEGCYIEQHFKVTCNHTYDPPKLFLEMSNVEITDIVLSGELSISFFIAQDCYNNQGLQAANTRPSIRLPEFPISYTRNKLTAVGCDTIAVIQGSNEGNNTAGCLSLCDSINNVTNGSCPGFGCCQTFIPKGMKSLSIRVSSHDRHTRVSDFNPCSYAFVAEETAYSFSSLDLKDLQGRTKVPVVLDWAVGNQRCDQAKKNLSTYACKDDNSDCEDFDNGPGYRCKCSKGYEGNPYIPNGCLGLCSGIGALLLLIASWWLYRVLKKRNNKKRKQKFFKRNGGLLLKEQLSSSDGSVEKIKLFSSKELEKATDHYNEDRILGQGGQGTVYKGMLSDGRIVAIKKSKIVDEGNVGQFINEVAILSQINNHRNVVKLLGCCLETEAPLVVYEYISNGTLFQHIHHPNEDFPLSWEMRLRIATEIAGALSYLHYAASVPIYHRDIKSTNILLDDKYRAKVADFGISRSVDVDQTHFTTRVQGTFGYLDPEYFQSSQFTGKSDVYSFGVVIVELLTGQKAVSSNKSQESRSLVTFFIQSIEDNHLFEIIDQKIMKEDWTEEIAAVAHLAKRCLNLNGKKRPTMKDVAVELEGIRMMRENTTTHQNYEVFEYNRTDFFESWDVSSTSTGTCFDSTVASSFDVKPLLLNEP